MILSAMVIFMNSAGEVLLKLKENKPDTLYPNYWTLLDTEVDQESGLLVKGIREEFSLDSHQFHFFKKYIYLDTTYKEDIELYTYFCFVNLPLLKVTLYEGSKIQYFNLQEVQHLKTPPIVKTILQDFAETKQLK